MRRATLAGWYAIEHTAAWRPLSGLILATMENQMDNSTTSNMGQQGQNFADRGAEKLKSGISDAKGAAQQAGDKLASTVESLRSNTGPAIDKFTGQAKAVAKQGVDAVNTMAGQVSDAASDFSDNIMSYTRENPMKALLIAVASGALLLTVVKALTPSRD